MLAPEVVEPRSRLRGGRIGPARGRGTLHVLLERGRRLPARDRGDLGLADADRGGEGLAVEPEPARGVGRAVEDLVGDVAAEDDVGRPTGDLAGQVLADLDRATVVEKQADLDGPTAVTVPRAMALLERALDLRPGSPPTPDPADPCADGGVPARLARLVRAGNDGQTLGRGRATRR